MKYTDYYKLLDVERTASKAEIKKAYRLLARKYHPDVSKEPNAEARFKEIGEAYEVLKDTEKRNSYDQLGSNWKQGQSFNPPPGWQGQGQGGFGGGGASFSDFFETMFGGGHAQAGGGFGGQQNFRKKGQDQTAKIDISIEDSFHGAERSITLSQGDGSSRTLSVKIPKGIKQGQKIRLTGQGMPGTGGGPAGSLLLEVSFMKHQHYYLEEKDLHYDLDIAPWEAALGEKITIPTPAGDVGLKIPAGSQSGRKMRLKNRGLPGKPSGDLFVHIKIVTPAADSEKNIEFYQNMAKHFDFNPREA